MGLRSWVAGWLLGLGVGVGVAAPAQTVERAGAQAVARVPIVLSPPGSAAGVPQSTGEAVGQMAARAGVIFVGEVTAVRLPREVAGSPAAAAEGLVEVMFRVDEAVRGVSAGEPFVLREWAGLWAGGVERYRVGQRLLMLLHAPDAMGLSSPVDGMDGAIGVFGSGVAPGPEDTTTTPGGWMADLRWVQTKVLRTTEARTAVVDAAGVFVGEGGAASPEAGAPGLGAPGLGAPGVAGQVPGLGGRPVLLPLRLVEWRAPQPMQVEGGAAPLASVLALCRQAGPVE
jgi:hypothetical protein